MIAYRVVKDSAYWSITYYTYTSELKTLRERENNDIGIDVDCTVGTPRRRLLKGLYRALDSTF